MARPVMMFTMFSQNSWSIQYCTCQLMCSVILIIIISYAFLEPPGSFGWIFNYFRLFKEFNPLTSSKKSDEAIESKLSSINSYFYIKRCLTKLLTMWWSGPSLGELYLQRISWRSTKGSLTFPACRKSVRNKYQNVASVNICLINVATAVSDCENLKPNWRRLWVYSIGFVGLWVFLTVL